MKKLFGFLTLFLCLLLTACNMNLLSDRSGSIDFSIPTKDIIDAANNYAARGADNDQTWNYAFLVQIKGNRGYYDYQLQTLTVETHEDFGNLNPGQINGLYVKNNNVNFSFNNVPAGQKYKIMFDAFIYYTIPNGDGSYYKTFSGNTGNIKVKPGKPSEVGITAKAPDESMFNLVIVTENAGTITIPAESAMDMLFVGNPGGNSPIFEKQFGVLTFKTSQDDKSPKVVKDVYLSLSPDANIDSNSFNISFLYGERVNPSRYNLKFSNNTCSIKSFLLQGLKFSDDDIRQISWPVMQVPGIIQISKNGFSYEEPVSGFQFSSNDEYISGHTSQTLTFEKKTYGNNEKVLLSTQELISLGVDPWQGESLVLVLTAKEDNLISSATQLYFKMSNEPFLDSTVNGATLFAENNCITHKEGEKKFIIPLNKLGNLGENPYFILFITTPDSAPDNINVTFDIDYCIFPSDMEAYVFGVGQNYNSAIEHRYEINRSTPVDVVLENGNTYKSKISGNVLKLNLSSGLFSDASITLDAELNDNVDYGGTSFHPLSNNAFDGNGNVKQLETYVDKNGVPSYSFIFKSITSIPDLTGTEKNHDFRFQCTTPCEDTNTLLVVRDWGWEFTIWNQ
ncbi:MAG: hypothetical protein IK024_07580 [Treponema sp.]|nr:hypothetical protein [Treponema sp.]